MAESYETCECGEFRKVSIKVAPLTEKHPRPIWRYHCRTCEREWTVDHNLTPPTDA